jgi:hypothetical protein
MYMYSDKYKTIRFNHTQIEVKLSPPRKTLKKNNSSNFQSPLRLQNFRTPFRDVEIIEDNESNDNQ